MGGQNDIFSLTSQHCWRTLNPSGTIGAEREPPDIDRPKTPFFRSPYVNIFDVVLHYLKNTSRTIAYFRSLSSISEGKRIPN
jgi:hypothetical protein